MPYLHRQVDFLVQSVRDAAAVTPFDQQRKAYSVRYEQEVEPTFVRHR